MVNKTGNKLIILSFCFLTRNRLRVDVMAGGAVAHAEVAQRRLDPGADLGRPRTARTEAG
jgi:hypothetical protein